MPSPSSTTPNAGPDAGTWNEDSVLALGTIDHTQGGDNISSTGFTSLQSAAYRQLWRQEQVKWPRGLQYFENASYLQGNHLTRYYYSADRGLGFHQFGIHDKSPFDNLVAKVADNRMIRPVESVTGLLTEVDPIPNCPPNSDLPEDEDAAAIAQTLIELVWEQPLNMRGLQREMAMIGCICGTVAVEVEYGDTEVLEIRPTVRPVEEETDLGTLTRYAPGPDEVVPRRDISAKAWTPYHITVDPTATKPEDMKWVSRTTFEDIDWIKQNYDVDAPGFYPQNLEAMQQSVASNYILYWYAKFQDIIESPQYYQHGGGLSTQSWSTHGGYAPNQTTFTVIDVRPTPEFPRGRTMVLAGTKLVYVSPKDTGSRAWSAQYPWRWHPYAFWGWFKVPGKFWHVPLLSEIVPLQKKINAIDSLTHANRQYMAIGQWLLPKQAKVGEGKLSGIPGQHITYTDYGGKGPERVGHVPLPGELLAERAELIAAIDVIASSGTLSGGGADKQASASAARSGPVLDFLQNQKLQGKSPMLREYEQCLETIGQNILIEVQLNMREDDTGELRERMLVAAREHSEVAVDVFEAASLRDHHAVRIDIVGSMKNSPEAKSASAAQALQFAGQFMDQGQIMGAFDAMGLGQFMKSTTNISRKRAKRMISRIMAEQFELVMPMLDVEDPIPMAEEFQKALLSEKMLKAKPQVWQALREYYQMYAQAAHQAKMQQLEMQMLLQGGGEGAEGSPGGGEE